jgi:hypothetical protein
VSALLLERARPASLVAGAGGRDSGRTAGGVNRAAGRTLTLFEDLGGGPTLDTLVAGVWEGLVAQSVVACPVCGGRMVADMSVAAAGGARASISGHCGGCGSVIE